MFFIFGWGHQITKNYGVTFKNHCSSCNNEEYWQLLRITTWFTLFFIPVIPYERKYFLMCPVCEKGVYLDSDKFEELKNLAEANSDLIDKKITVEEYNQRLVGPKKIEEEAVGYIEGEIEQESGSKDNNKISIIFCSDCGHKNDTENNFCQNCGEKIK